MASPIITPLPVQTDTEYRPISKMAVVGFILAIPSLAIFMSDNLFWVFLVFTIPAMILSTMALRSIRSSEGNLAGEAVAMLGIVISVASGLGWLTMTVVTKYITESEARSQIEIYFDKMKTNQPGAAFLMMNPPKFRHQMTFNPEEHAKLRKMFPAEQASVSMFDSFLVDPVCGPLLRYGDKVKLTYAGLVEAKVERGSINYRFRYLLESPVTKGSCIVLARSEDFATDEGIRRDWITGIDRNSSVLQDTAYGEQLKVATLKCSEEVERVIFAIANDEKEPIKEILDPKITGEFSTVLGYLRSPDRKGPVFVSLLKPLRLRADKLEGKTWTLTFDCTTSAEKKYGVDFSLTLTNDPATNKWKIIDCRFLGMRKVHADGPVAVAPTKE